MADGGARADASALPDRLYEGYAFDLDGTTYLGDDLLPGAGRLIERLRELGKKVAFLSNNATKGPEVYAQKLTRPDYVLERIDFLLPQKMLEELGWTEVARTP